MRCPDSYIGFGDAIRGMRHSYAPGIWIGSRRIIFIAPTRHRLPHGRFISLYDEGREGWFLEIFDESWLDEDMKRHGTFQVASSKEFLMAKSAAETRHKEIELSVETAKAILWYAEQKKIDDEQDAKDEKEDRMRQVNWLMSEEERIAEKIRNDAKEIGSLMQKIRGMKV